MSIENAFAGLGNQELTDNEVRTVLARYLRRRRTRPLTLALAVLGAAVVAIAVPPSRAELRDALAAAFHGGDLPGYVLPANETPNWLREVPVDGRHAPHVIAEVDGHQMLVFRERRGDLCFDLGGIGICGFSEADLFADQPVALLGPTEDRTSGRFQLWGLTLASVASVELRFADAPPVQIPANGAFGISLEPHAKPTTLVAYDAERRVVGTLQVSERWERRPGL